MEEKLDKIHSQVNELLRFAEAKNVGLLAFNGVIIVEGLKNLYEHQEALKCWAIFLLFYIIILNTASFLICLSSLFPNRRTKIEQSKNKNLTNPLFFGTIATLNETEYLAQLKEKYELTPSNEAYCLDIIKQLIVQSQILVRKLNSFKVASLFTFCAFATPLGYLFYLWFLKPKNED
jgi:hypothetical protein